MTKQKIKYMETTSVFRNMPIVTIGTRGGGLSMVIKKITGRKSRMMTIFSIPCQELIY